MSGEAGCFFRDQKRRIGEYNYMVMFSEKSMLVTKMFLIKLTKVNTFVRSFVILFFITMIIIKFSGAHLVDSIRLHYHMYIQKIS